MDDDYIRSLRRLIGCTEISTPGVRVVVLDPTERILLEERRDFELWGLPGGIVDPGEDILQAAQREVYEETGFSVSGLMPFGFSSSPFYERIEYPNGDKLHSFNLLLYTREYQGCERVSEESKRLGWFAPHELPPMLNNMRRTAMAYLAFEKNHEFQLL